MIKVNVDEAAAYLRTADNCLIYTHTNPDADTIGSAGTLALALRKLGRRARVFCADALPARLSFLRDAAGADLFTHEQDAAATPLSVDVASENQLGISEAPLFMLSVDHHAVNRIACERLLLKDDYPAAGEIVYELLCALGIPLDRTLATLLYAAISSDSGGFRYSSTRPQTHLCAAKLLGTGIDFAKINRLLFETKSEVQTALEKAAYNRLELHCGGKLAVVALDEALMNELGASESDVDCVNQIPRQLAGVEVSAVLRPTKGGTKVSLRSNEFFDVAAFAASLGGGGHIHAAGCRFALPVAEARDELVRLLTEKLG